MTLVAQPFPPFTDVSNRLLDNGYVYVGEPNQDPETHPVAVYSDLAMTIPLSQPLRTVSGVLVNGVGAPTNAYVDGEFSLRVRNFAGVHVFYQAVATTGAEGILAELAGPDGAGLIGYQPPGDGAITLPLATLLNQQWVSIASYGAVADNTAVGNGTDNYNAIMAAIAALGDAGGTVFLPAGRYRVSQRIPVRTGINFVGPRVGQNPGVIQGTTYTGSTFLYGAVLVFDTNTAGLYFIPFTDEVNQSTIANSIATEGNASPYWQYPSSDRSQINDLTLLSSGTSNALAHGIETRSRVNFTNVVIRGFSGDGLRIWGSTDGSYAPANVPYGNPGASVLTSVRCVLNHGAGFYIAGRDANGIALVACDAISNTGWGFDDAGFLGNSYTSCLAQSNTAGSYRQSAATALTTYIGCYVEAQGAGPMTDLTAASLVLGGQMASEQLHAANSRATVIGLGLLPRGGLQKINYEGALNVAFGMGYPGSSQTIFTFGSEDYGDTLDDYKFFYDDTNKAWNLQHQGNSSYTPWQLPTGSMTGNRTTAPGSGFGPAFSCFYWGQKGIGPGRGAIHTYGSAAPSTGAWTQGDLVWNTAPTSPGGFVGWVCTASGTPGTWKTFGAISA